MLYVVHAVLTGIAMVVMDLLGVKLGFGFSAGLIDYVLNFGLAKRPLLLIPVGIVYFGIYYATFSWCIRRFDLKTPGREVEETAAPAAGQGGRGAQIVQALGGAGNIRSVDACTTRLRLVLADTARVDDAALRGIGARGVVKLSDGAVQVVLGPIADQVASEVRDAMAGPVPSGIDGAAVATALGAGNLQSAEVRATRVLARVGDPGLVDEAALRRAGVRAVAISGGTIHLIVGPDATRLAAELAG
jgi:PTS system N-acetylglucosamine-specific IIC component